jgi:hypothetical protein
LTTVTLHYTVRKRGNLFWQPTPKMQALGFKPKALGPEGPDSIAEAKRLYEAWKIARDSQGVDTRYPEGSFGHYVDLYKRTKAWAKKAVRTREDYDRAWKQINTWRPAPSKPTLSCTVIDRITPDLCEAFYEHLAAAVSPSERYRVVKCLKALLEDARVRLRWDYASPADVLRNPQPQGRSAIWLAAEIEDMSAVAAISGFEAMSLAIEVAWETMFSPVDVRTLRPRQMKRDAGGYYFHRARTKTDVEAFGYISEDLAVRLLAYLERQKRAEADDTPIFRTRDFAVGSGRRPRAIAYRTKDLFAKDFRAVREIVFPGDTRQLMDIRRSANVEADAAGADKKTMGELLANGLADSRFLDQTYTPATVTKARQVAEQRADGRTKLAAEAVRLRAAN